LAGNLPGNNKVKGNEEFQTTLPGTEYDGGNYALNCKVLQVDFHSEIEWVSMIWIDAV